MKVTLVPVPPADALMGEDWTRIAPLHDDTGRAMSVEVGGVLCGGALRFSLIF